MSTPPEVEPDRSWLPTEVSVGALLPARFGPAGVTEGSRPSSAQVLELITMLTDSTLAVTDEPTPRLRGLARTTVAIGVASYIENGFFPEQSEVAGGPAEFFRRRYAELRTELRDAIVTDRRAVLAP